MLPLGHSLEHQAFPRHLAFILDKDNIVARPQFADLEHGSQLFRCASHWKPLAERFKLLCSPSLLHLAGLYPASSLHG
ncbi:hypothetical protein HBI56_216020 [Parastagonospora nodorum]|uniref:Uncharacterized protein n=1 Tax=Phaeosphaeria nodorum (strain SN15 / ATCC MYA-4574 / FGSC 10173) TaxID=321614 RepID=A0A7U2F001_PHANO|nr:hypothetical protein HBH56_176440 [Parastagonospora nodorum]QRC96191.1 hypothetical protein JI435_408390 [Parastagonospora nodorum SN15]KAH3926428.1 hypothetical protein HBH54_166720 [Parastagonospora nodorum]KAH3939155.1 hypothetical protein HBH53_240200 [Parastagonospora nodorum]KAH3965645.1 hypothetical protein HBH52_203360 [Parastagonospora nodorum]